MTAMTRTPSTARPMQGEVLAIVLHVLLLAVVLGELVYLGSRHRVRIDATSDDQYSLTESTRRIVGNLDKRLVIEAYLSPKADMPATLRDMRTVLDNFLDELVQLGNGKVVVQRFNPLDDKAIADKCTRIGIKPVDARTSTTNALEVKRHWQGVRLVYGGGKQKVIEKIGPRSTFEAEATLTMAIKEVATQTRKKIGFMEWQTEPPPGTQPPQGIGWSSVRSMDLVAKRYEFQNVKDQEGVLVPNDIDTLLLFRPRDLTDRQKYVVDQFLMRGGSVVVFADVADYGIAPRRQFNKLQLQLDAKDSLLKWQDQLLHYGVDLPGKLVADMQPEAWRASAGQEYFGVQTPLGFAQQIQWYPYFFHPLEFDWATQADGLAALSGRKDQALVDFYKQTLRPGMDSDEFLFKGYKRRGRGPGFYWPSAVDVRRKNGQIDLPAGVEGKVVLWSSPRSLTEDPPQSLDPIGQGDPAQQQQQYTAFVGKLKTRLDSEQPHQTGLMVALHGKFPSFFVGKGRPKKPSEIKEDEAKKKAAEEAQAKEGEEPKKDDGKVAADPPVKPVGPEPPPETVEQDAVTKVQEPEPVLEAKADGRLVVIGDSDFVRDDFVGGSYAQAGGPQSLHGPNFFLQLVDWLSQDSDLVALQMRAPIDRKIELVATKLDRTEDPRDTEKRIENKKSTLVWLNVFVPCGLLLGLGLITLLVRREQKRQFLAAIGN